jgi:hypothetical protein
MFRLSLHLLSETFFILRRTEQDMVFMCSALYSCPILTKLEFSRQIFEIFSNIIFHENSPSGSRVVPDGQTDAWTDMTKLIVAFRNFVKSPKMIIYKC